MSTVDKLLTEKVANGLKICYTVSMHKTQIALINLAKHQDLNGVPLRQIAKMLGIENRPQTVKHHLSQLDKAGLMQVNLAKGVIKLVNRGFNQSPIEKSPFYSLPIVGMANCGPATIFANERVEGYLKVSSRMLPWKKQDLYVLITEGSSMNKAEVKPGITIEDGDFVIVDSTYQNPKNGDIIVAVIDGMGTIKRYKEDKKHHRIILEAESTEKFFPIFIHKGDNFVISGKVVDVIKK
jgi:SOS-response transcriptional repressor LexA